ncbi:nSTAND1 domain-containing NTPase [Oscillatoria salina]|uniref:nSTAND1 domain-containing NTPase n=1 Tax=Oscillatoria salina TaxID=331517 RepID=UPI001CCAFA1A|nr:AAA family ATPase [Oscillatoria salina]MBZ8180312.1 hypothetical protein [Oscillatoria salina IIICB1]
MGLAETDGVVASRSRQSRKHDDKFVEAEETWELKKLYRDLTAAKQIYNGLNNRKKILTPVEKCYLRGLLCLHSPEKIALELGDSLGTVKVALSNGLYRYVEALLETKLEEQIKIRWDNIYYLLDRAGYKKEFRSDSLAVQDPLSSEQLSSLSCPYRGLSAFKTEDAAYFFGREQFTEKLLEAVRSRSLVAVVGASGSGKSSVIAAGLIYSLSQDSDWIIVSVRLGNSPFYALAAALIPALQLEISEVDKLKEIKKLATMLRLGEYGLRDVVEQVLQQNRQAKQLLLVIDQFEELFTLCPSAEEVRRFLDELTIALQAAMAQPKSNFKLAIALRADFYGYAIAHRAFSDCLQGAIVNLSSMNNQELREAIAKPAQMIGVEIETGLTERILEAVSKEPGNLPLLEFALTLLWEKSLADWQLNLPTSDSEVKFVLTHKAYEEIGGVELALAQHAEKVYDSLHSEAKQQAQQIFIQLVRPGEGTADTRRLATRTQLGENSTDLVMRLADARLVVTGRDKATGEETVEIVHEALISGWERLRQWMEIDREFRIWQEQLRFAINQWEVGERKEDLLLPKALLAKAEVWQEKRFEDLAASEINFIEASKIYHEKEAERWRRVCEEAQQQKQIALAHQLAVQAEMLRRTSSDLLVRSVLLAVESLRRYPTLEGAQTLRRGLALLPRPVASMQENQFEWVLAAAFSGDGNYLATLNESDCLQVWNVQAEEEIHSIQPASAIVARPKLMIRDRAIINPMALSFDGQFLATASLDNTVRLWNLTTQKYFTFASKAEIKYLAFSEDGRFLAAASEDDLVRIWNLTNGEEICLSHEEGVRAIAFSSDRQFLATVGMDNTAKIWDLAHQKEVTAKTYQGFVSHVVFTEDGKCLAVESRDSNLYIWNVFSGEQVTCLTHKGNAVALNFSPQGKYLASADDGRYYCNSLCCVNCFEVVYVWNLNRGTEVARITHPTIAVAFSFDETKIATVGRYSPARRVWEINTGEEVVCLPCAGGSQGRVSFNPNLETLATICQGEVQLWSIKTGQNIVSLAARKVLAISPDWRYLVVADEGEVCLQSMEIETNKYYLTYNSNILNTVWSGNGRNLAIATSDRLVKVWQLNENSEVKSFPQEGEVQDLALSYQGKYLAVVVENLTYIWDVFLLEEIIALEHLECLSTAVSFSFDEEYLAVGNYDGIIEVWRVKDWSKVTSMRHDWDVRETGRDIKSIAFSPDGKYLATACADCTARVWEIATGREIGRMTHEDCVWAVEFSLNGKYIATNSSDGTARVWLWRSPDLIAEACRSLTRNLYEEEWQQYLGNEPYRPTCPNLP